MSTHQSFIDDVEAFLERTGIKPTQFGAQALRDPSFVISLRNGRSPSARTIDRVREFMRANDGRSAA